MLLSYAWKEIKRRKSRSLLTITGIFLSIALLVAVLAVLQFFKEAMKVPFKAAGADMVVETFTEPGPFSIVRLSRHLGPIPQEILGEIKKIEGVKDAVGLLMFWAYEPPNTMYNLGSVDVTNPSIGPLALVPGIAGQRFAIVEGRSFDLNDKYAMILDKKFAEKKGLRVGSHIKIANRDFEVIGIADFQGVPRAAEAEMFIPLTTAQEMVSQSQRNVPPGSVNLLLIKLSDPKVAKAVKEKVVPLVAQATGLKPSQVKVFTSESILPDTTGVSALGQTLIKVLSILVVIGIAILVMRTTVASIGERTREIGIMKALGWRGRDITKLLTWETLIQTLIGGILGCIVGYLVAYAYAHTANFVLPHGVLPYSCVPAAAPPEKLVVAMGIYWWIVGLSIGIAVVVGILSGYLAARKAIALKPAEAIRTL